MKIVVNKCYGGFSLSPIATKEYLKRKGKKCYFFKLGIRENLFTPITLKQAEGTDGFWTCYTVPNPGDYRLSERDPDGLYCSANKRAEKISFNVGSLNRHDKDLVAVVEKLGKKADGEYADLRIVNIPDGIEYIIDEYDGFETIHEKHKFW